MTTARRVTIILLALICSITIAAPAAAQYGSATGDGDAAVYANYDDQVVYSIVLDESTSASTARTVAQMFDADLLEDTYAGVDLRVTDEHTMTSRELRDIGLDYVAGYEIDTSTGPGLALVVANDTYVYLFIGAGYLLDVDHFTSWTADVIDRERIVNPRGFVKYTG